MKNILLVGFGKLGKEIAKQILNKGHQLSVLTRSIHQPTNDFTDITFMSYDIRSTIPSHLQNTQFDDVIICVTPANRNKISYKDIYLDGVLRFVKQINSSHVWFISSSAVYQHNDGSWVDEHSKCSPDTFNGKVLLECENAISEFCSSHNIKSTSLRLAGIYGGDRRHLINLIENEHYPEQLHYTNRIHQTDAAIAIAQLVDLNADEPIINICDDCPATMNEIADFIRLKLDIKNKRDWPKPLLLNKRISNKLLKRYYTEFRYPNFEKGLNESLEN